MIFVHINSSRIVLYITIIFNTLINLSSANDNYNNIDTNNNDQYNTTKNETDSTDIMSDPGSYLLTWFFIFFFMGLYIICVMKQIPKYRNRTDDVWKFMFFANNGILVASSVNVFNIHNLIIDSSPFALSSIIFIIGCIYYICKYCKICSMECAEMYFQCGKISELAKIPGLIWNLVSLTKNCCICDTSTYTVYYYADGHTEDDRGWKFLWNCIICVIKKLATIFSIISFYIFLIFYIFYWLIANLIFSLVKASKNRTEQSQEPQPQPEINPNYGQEQNINSGNNNPPSNEKEIIINQGHNFNGNGNNGIVMYKNNINECNAFYPVQGININTRKININIDINENENYHNNFNNDNNFQSMDIDNKTRNIHPDNLTLIPKQCCESRENININKPVNDGNINRIDNNYEKNEYDENNKSVYDLPEQKEVEKQEASPNPNENNQKDEIKENYENYNHNENNMDVAPAPGMFDDEI